MCNTSLQAWLWHQGRNLWLQFFQVQHKKYVVLCYPGKCKEKELLFWFRLTYPGKTHLSFPFSLLSTLPEKLLGTIPSSPSLAWHVELWGGTGTGREIHHIACHWFVFSFYFYYSILWKNWSFSGARVQWEYLEEISDKEKKINRQADTYLWVGPWVWQEERLEKKLLLSIGGCIRQRAEMQPWKYSCAHWKMW